MPGSRMPLADSLLLSLGVSGLAMLIVLVYGLALGWLLARQRFAGARLLNGLLLLPMVLPPTVTGFYLVWLLGRQGPIGRLLGVTPLFHWSGAVIAAAVVSSPLMLQSARAAFETVPRELEEVAACLGLGPWQRFWRVGLPLAGRGLLAGAMLSFARALGEFGATLMLAGNIPGKTQTMPLAIYELMLAGEDGQAAVLVGILTAISIGATLLSLSLSRSKNV